MKKDIKFLVKAYIRYLRAFLKLKDTAPTALQSHNVCTLHLLFTMGVVKCNLPVIM